ncbi:MAG: shikimate kinase [Gemmatimonadota bacterium]
MTTPARVQRLVLVGLPGAGKTTTGRALALRLGWNFIDLDTEIERRTGRTIAELFHSHGEVAFRAMERELTVELSLNTQIVLTPGGGWAAQPGLMESLPPGSVVVWLQVSPEEAFRRLRGSPVERPLLSGPDPLAALGSLAEQRTERYARADLAVPVDGRSADDVAEIIIEWLERSI